MSILAALFGAGTWGTGGNLVASALLFALGALGTWLAHRAGLLRKLAERTGPALSSWWAEHHPHKDKIDRALAAAEAAHRIAAATHEHLTGKRHPDSPERGGS